MNPLLLKSPPPPLPTISKTITTQQERITTNQTPNAPQPQLHLLSLPYPKTTKSAYYKERFQSPLDEMGALFHNVIGVFVPNKSKMNVMSMDV